MSGKYVLTIDQSTSGSKCLLVDEKGNIKYKVTRSHKQIYPKLGWVEHDPLEIYENVKSIAKELITLNDINEEVLLD